MFNLTNPPASICILRLSAIGDATHVLPIIHTLKKTWPDTKLTWVIGKVEHKLVGHLGGVEFIIFDKSQGRKAYQQLKEGFKDREFDVLLHMQVAMRANLASRHIKAKVKIGYDKARSKDLHGFFIDQRIPATPEQHVVDAFHSFLDVLGISEKTFIWKLPIPEEAQAFANKHLTTDKPIAVISPCSSHKLRNWMPERYGTVANYCVKRLGYHVVLCGGPTQIEHQYGEEIARVCSAPVQNLIGQDTLLEFLAVLKRAEVLITPDSAPAHMANILDIPVVGLYAASNPRRSGPYKSVRHCVDKYGEAALKFKNKPQEQLKWGTKIEEPGVMELIQVEDVIQRLEGLHH